MSVYAVGAMIVTETSLPPFWKKPLLPLEKPALVSTCSAAAVLAVLGMVADDTGPAPPSEASGVRSTARLIACRTASWLVGHLVRFGSRLSSPPAASQKLWWAGSVGTKFFCRPGMEFPVPSIWLLNSALSAPVLEV